MQSRGDDGTARLRIGFHDVMHSLLTNVSSLVLTWWCDAVEGGRGGEGGRLEKEGIKEERERERGGRV